MKKVSLLLATLIATSAWATPGNNGGGNGGCGVGQQTNGCGTTNTTNSSSDSNANAGAVGVGVGVGVGIGGSGGSGGSSSANGVGTGGVGMGGAAGASSNAQGGNATGGTSYSALSNDIGYSNSMRAITFAAPAWTVVPTASGCVVSSSTAWSAVFGLASYSGSKQASDAVCTMVNMAAAAQNACQYRTAATINRRVFETLTGASGEFFEKNAPQDLGPVDCALLVKYTR